MDFYFIFNILLYLGDRIDSLERFSWTGYGRCSEFRFKNVCKFKFNQKISQQTTASQFPHMDFAIISIGIHCKLLFILF